MDDQLASRVARAGKEAAAPGCNALDPECIRHAAA